MFRLTWSKTSIIDNIHKLEDQNLVHRCNVAYEYLMQNYSSYKHFVNLRELAMKDNETFNIYNCQQSSGIECALWPMLYPETQFHEMTLNRCHNQASSKVVFMKKVFCELTDCSPIYELLQFHYDLWLFKTVTGAIATTWKAKCPPA